MLAIPIIDTDKCDGCGLCVSVCACGALVIVNKVATIKQLDDCQWCTLCEAACPNGALLCPFEIVFGDE